MWVSVILTVAFLALLATLAATPATHVRTATLECESLRPTSPGFLARRARLAVVSESKASLASAAFSVHGLPEAPRIRSAFTRAPTVASSRAWAAARVRPERSTPPASTPAGTLVGSLTWAEAVAGSVVARAATTSRERDRARDMAHQASAGNVVLRNAPCGPRERSGRVRRERGALVARKELVDPAPGRDRK